MTAEYLYDALKMAMNSFGLSWGEKSEINVCLKEGSIVFTYRNLEITVKDFPTP